MSWKAPCLFMSLIAANLHHPSAQSWPSRRMSLLFRACWTAWAAWERQYFGICCDYRMEFSLKIKKSKHQREKKNQLWRINVSGHEHQLITSEEVLDSNIQLFRGEKKKEEKMEYLSVLSLIAVHKDFTCQLVQEGKQYWKVQFQLLHGIVSTMRVTAIPTYSTNGSWLFLHPSLFDSSSRLPTSHFILLFLIIYH